MIGFILIILFSLIPLAGLLHPGLPETHDGVDHVARIVAFYESLRDGNIIPRWAGNLNWGYGHPILMFLYPAPSYIASLFHFIGLSFVDSLKMTFAVAYIASGITMHLWSRRQFGVSAGLIISALYIFAPYRFIDLYVRGAFGEHVAFVFPPLVLYFLHRLFHGSRNKNFDTIGVGVSFALLLLSHNAISLIFLPVIFSYITYLFFVNRNKMILIYSIFGLFYGFLLSSFFVIPAIFEAKHTLRDIVIGNEYRTRYVENWFSFVYGQWSYGISGQFSVQIGIIHLIGIIFLPLVLISKKIDKKIKPLIFGMLILFILSIFIQLSISNFVYEIFGILKNFQFPWRFLSLSVFTSSVLAGSVLLLIKKPFQKYFVVIIMSLVLFFSYEFWNAKGYRNYETSNFLPIYNGTTDTGESAPKWSVRFMEKKPKQNIEIISGEAIIKEEFRSSIVHKYKVDVRSDDARIRENTLYFPGWEVFLNKINTKIEFQDPSERGLITFYIPKGIYDVEVVFRETKIRKMSNLVSFISVNLLLIFAAYIVLKRYVFNKKG